MITIYLGKKLGILKGGGGEASTPQKPYIKPSCTQQFHNNVLIADRATVSVTHPAVTSWESGGGNQAYPVSKDLFSLAKELRS